MREVPLADNGVVCWPGCTLKKAYEETESVHLVGCLGDGQATCEDAPEQLTTFSLITMVTAVRAF